MIFDKPIPFAEALASRKAKRILPTTAGSAELSKLAPEIRERAMFSARTADVGYLAKMDRLITGLVDPIAARGSVPGRMSALSVTEVKAELRKHLASIGYVPDKGDAGTLKDLSSDPRQTLIVNMQVQEAHGFGQEVMGNDPDIIDDYPCWELIRGHQRKEPRDWQERWVRAGGKLYEGRMIARKDAPIWTAISEFGRNYPPYDYNSGMVRESVSRTVAERLGVIKRSTVVKPKQPNLNDSVEVSMPQGISNGLADVLQMVFETKAGKLILTPNAAQATAAIDTVFAAAQAGEKMVRDYGPVSALAAERIQKETGIDVAGYEHALDADSVRHILNQHGNAAKEAAKGQLAVTLQDFEALPYVVETGTVKAGGLTKQGLETIEYSKQIGGELIVIEEVRTGKKKLIPKTMYKKKPRASRAD